MKRLFIALLTALLLSPAIEAQPPQDSAKDLFYAADEAVPRRVRRRTQGRPGAMVKIELKRKGQVKPNYVSPKMAFASGDKVRLHIRVNRSGYLTVFNEGTSGKLQLIYPQTMENANSPVLPTVDFTIPATQGRWLEFDENTGVERLHIVLSAKPIPEVAAFLASNASGGSGSPSGQGGAVPGSAQEQEIVDALNSKAFRDGLDASSKDFTETSEDQTPEGQAAVFVVSTSANTTLKKPVVYKLALKHGR